MFESIKRMLGSSSAARDDGQALAAWAKAEGYTFKHVKHKSGIGFVVESGRGWRVELGPSQRSYIPGLELRFRADTGLHGDVQMIMVTKVLAHTLESEVFTRFTNAMQTQIDNTMPDEMRWLAMHPRSSLSGSPLLSKRFVLFCNAETVAQLWLDAGTLQTLEQAATSWWTDSLMLVLTVNRGILTIRMSGQGVEQAQLKMVGDLFGKLMTRMRVVAQEVS
jgi:hypothetical protein